MKRIAILDDYQSVALGVVDWGCLAGDASIEAFHDRPADEDALVRLLAPFEIVVAMRDRTALPRRVLERLPKLELLVHTGGRVSTIDVAAAAELGITVCATGSVVHTTAELTWALILATMRHIPAEDRAIRAGGWQVGLGRGLAGRTLGVVGLGRLGGDVARIGLAFRMEVVAWSPNLTPARAAEAGVRLVGRDELFRESDVVTIHLVLSERSRGLVGARELGLMKPTACLVNTSRGPIVDEAALIAALRAKRIAAAAIDVFDVEPLPADHPLRGLENTIVTPHIGYVTEENYRRYYGDAVESIRAHLDGRALHVVAAPARPRRGA